MLRIEVPPLRFVGRPPRTFLAVEYWGWVRWGIHELWLSRGAGRGDVGSEPARSSTG